MNPQGISGVTAADVPQILTQEAGTAAPIALTDEAGSVVAASSLTALFNASGTYVGSYGIDPSTGAFAAWDANGNETSFQTFAAEHQLASGAVPTHRTAETRFSIIPPARSLVWISRATL